MEYKIQLYTDNHRTRFMLKDVAIFGPNNIGKIINADSENDAVLALNSVLPIGLQYNKFYLKVTKI